MTEVHDIKGWRITVHKSHISSSDEIDALEAQIGIPIPEMIFGNNYVQLEHAESGWLCRFDATSALDLVDKKADASHVQVSYAKKWQSNKPQGEDIQGVVRPFDWTYTTPYRGSASAMTLQPSDKSILPADKLKRPDEILFYQEVPLFEDELGDNGIANLTVRIRVMPERLFVLARLFVRVDDVILRVRDTRLFVEFAEGLIIREYTEHEETYDTIKRQIPDNDYGLYMRDVNWLVQRLRCRKAIVEQAIVNAAD